MGNKASVFNDTGEPLIIHVFNNTDVIYKVDNGVHKLPVTSGLVTTISGTAGGGAVKVGVLYQNKQEESFVYDIFSVKHGGALHIKKFSEDDGVIEFSGDAVLVEKGLVVKPMTKEDWFLFISAFIGAIVRGLKY